MKAVNDALDQLYETFELGNRTGIHPGIFFSGDGMCFLFSLEPEKYARIEISQNFGEWMACCTNGWTQAAPAIEALVKPYGVQWDNGRGILFIRFRRNEMTVAQAVLRLQQAALVAGSLGTVIELE